MAIQWQKIFLQPQNREQLPPQASHFYNHAPLLLKTQYFLPALDALSRRRRFKDII